MRPDDALATILLASRMASEGTHPLKASEYWRLVDQVGEPGALLGRGAPQLIAELDPDLSVRISALLDRGTSMAFELERLDQTGITTLTSFDADYPSRWRKRLGSGAPPVVHVAGPPHLLRAPGVAILSDGDRSPEASAVASDLAAEAVRLGSVVVTGGVDGIDRAIADTALEEGGAVATVLADPLLRTVRRPEVRRAVLAGTTVLCTPYAPDARATAAATIGRDRLIHALARATVVVANGTEGDVLAGTVAAIDGGFTVAVWRGPGEGPGNAALETCGATSIRSADELAAHLPTEAAG
jgi:predicted Rossmann fold nucleotide-binding protein DprA/Smf involved in DNA uptake